MIHIVPVSSATNNLFDPSAGSKMTSGAIMLSAINCSPGILAGVSTTGGGGGGGGGVVCEYELFFLHPVWMNN
jgi:hypothetical protein